MMKSAQFWQKNLNWLLIIWCIYAFLTRPGWVAFAAGVIGWALVVYLTAPGVFWTYVYLLPFRNSYDLERTSRRLQRAIAKKPLIALPYTSLGILYARNNRWAEAIPLLETAIRFGSKKEQVEFRTVLAVAYRENGAYERALSVLDELVAQGAGTYKVYYNYAVCYLRQNRLTEALTAAQRARSLETTAVEPVLLLARIYFALPDYRAAKDNLEWAIARTNWPVESFYWLGRAELELGKLAPAVEHLAKSVMRITEDPNLADVPVTEAQDWLTKAQAALATATATAKDDNSAEEPE
jgi:tetratricopeptide (TPR) repeat protein